MDSQKTNSQSKGVSGSSQNTTSSALNKTSPQASSSGSNSYHKSSAAGSSPSGSQGKSSSSADMSGNSLKKMQSGGKPSDSKKEENDNICVLNEIYQNAQMGKQSISNIIPKIQDQKFKQDLVDSYENYDQLCSQSASEIIKLGNKPREKNPISKAMLWGTINVATLVNDSASTIADLMIKGSHNNVNNITRSLNQHSDNIDPSIKNLANSFIQNEQSSISNMQKYL